MNVRAFNPELDELDKTYLSSYTAKGATTLPVINNDRFINSGRVLIGDYGNESAEIVTLSSVNSNKLSLGASATLFDHNSDESVYMLQWDKIRFYRADSVDGTYTLQKTHDIDLTNSEEQTIWDDPTAVSTHFYKVAFYNSVTVVESDLSDPMPASGFVGKTAGKIIDGVVRFVRDPNFTILGISEYLDLMNEVNDELIMQAHRPYDFLRRTVTLNTVTNQGYIALPANLWKFDDVRVSTAVGGFVRFGSKTPRSLEDFYDRYEDTALQPGDTITDLALDDENRRLLLYPTPKTSQTGVVKMRYYKHFDVINSMSDVVETPTDLVYRYKMIAAYYNAKSESDRQWAGLAQKFEQKYGTEMVKMQRSNRMDAGSPRSFIGKRFRRNRRYHL